MARSNIVRTYYAKMDDDGKTPIVLYLSIDGPGYMEDKVLHIDGWGPTLSLTDWRFGENNDIEEVTRKAAKSVATGWGLGKYVK